MRKMVYSLYVFVFFALFIAFSFENVRAEYSDVCNGDEIQALNSNYKKCDDNIVYLIDNRYSSYINSTEDFSGKKQLLYAGKIDNADTFYTTKFEFHGVVFDNRKIGSTKENLWSDLSIDGVVRYTGKFNDNFLVDESSMTSTVYNEVGTYLIRQFVNGKIEKIIRVIVVHRLDDKMSVTSAKWGNNNLSLKEIVRGNDDIVFEIEGGDYGFELDANLKVNSCNIIVPFSKKMVISYSEFSDCLLDNDKNKITLSLVNGLGMQKDFKYTFNLVGEKVSIKLINSISTIQTSSRRIVIKASAGKGSELDTNYNLYYWSTSPNDNLTYDDFMSNYSNSAYKGSYSADTGVILRNETGTYYLYALAKDGNSEVVVRSDEYILTNSRGVNRIDKSNLVFLLGLIIISTMPIFIYLLIREKDTI